MQMVRTPARSIHASGGPQACGRRTSGAGRQVPLAHVEPEGVQRGQHAPASLRSGELCTNSVVQINSAWVDLSNDQNFS